MRKGFHCTSLTMAELRMIELAAAGLDTYEIARELILSDDTIGKAFHRIYIKLGIHGRVAKRLQRKEAIRQYLTGEVFE